MKHQEKHDAKMRRQEAGDDTPVLTLAQKKRFTKNLSGLDKWTGCHMVILVAKTAV